MSRLPIRVRLTLPFAVAMAGMLAALGGFLYLRVGSTLLHSADQTLFARATETTLRIDKGLTLLGDDESGGSAIAELLDANGQVVDSAPAHLPPFLDATRTRLIIAGGSVRETVTIPGRTGRWRLLGVPDPGHGALIVGSSLGAGDESLEGLRHELLIASPLALLLAVLAGYILAGAALRPVDEMRRKAGEISSSTGSRLPVPRARDELSRLAETLNGMLDRLEDAFEHERRFVADASHELRTPLALLRTELELALRHPRSREELEEALRSAAADADRLGALAGDLLLIARSEERMLPIHPESVSSLALLDRVAERFAGRAIELGRSVVVDPQADDVQLEADPRRVEQALGNLVENGFVHGTGTVTLGARQEGERIELHVRDEGEGFPPGFAARAFDRFSRADEARRRSGSGLGLAIVRTIAVAHGGSAAVSSEGAADAWISLPMHGHHARGRSGPRLGSRARSGA